MQPTPDEVRRRKDFIKDNYYSMSNADIARHLNMNEVNVRKHIRKMGMPPKNQMLGKADQMIQATSLFTNKLVENGLPLSWTVGWLKTSEASILIKNPEDIFRLEQLKEEWLQSIRDKAPTYKPFKYQTITEPHLLVIDPADVHIGKLAVKSETGEDYNVEIAIERVKEGVGVLLQKTKGFPIDKVLLVIGNDILHTDTTYGTTTKGTPQTTDGLWFENYKKAHALYVEVIDTLSTIANVHVVHCPSNHDVMSGFYLAQSLEAYYTKNTNITFDVTAKHRKYYQYGKNLLGFSHGDGAKETDLVNIMAHESKHMWVETEYHYWYLHHKHHMNRIRYQDGRDYIGASIEYLRAVSGTDGWHSRNGFLSQQSIYAFIHQKDQGQIAKITHHFQ